MIPNPKFYDQLLDHASAHLDQAMAGAVQFAEGIAPIDTSSYQLSIRKDVMSGDGLIRTGAVLAGGEDYSGQILSTGKEGRFVDYAIDIEIREGTMANSIGALLSGVEA
jgi:hypothetical protein